VVRAPAFARPLRSRVVAQLGAPAVSGGAWGNLPLVASNPRAGNQQLLARGVICQDGSAGEWCAPVLAPITVDVRVTASDAKAP
jgi:hypothetical protein